MAEGEERDSEEIKEREEMMEMEEEIVPQEVLQETIVL